MTVEAEEKPHAGKNDRIEFPSLHVTSTKSEQLPVSIRALEEEELQLSELYEIEQGQLVKIASDLTKITAQLGVAIHIEPSTFSEVLLTPDGNISLQRNNNVIASIAVDKLHASTLIDVIAEAVPEIKRLLEEKKLATADRASLLEKSADEFEKVSEAIPKTRSDR